MQNWDRNRQDVKFKQKLNNVKSTLPKISYATNSGPSIISKKSSNQGNNQNFNNLENLYMNVTYKTKQGSNLSGSNPSSTPTSAGSAHGSIPVLSKTKNNDMKHQNYLKHLLNEFGLSQYLRKLYELGYDDNNVNRIGLMNRKSFQELLNNMKMYPGQSIKMEKLYEYLKQLNLASTMYNTRLIGGRTNMKNVPKKPLTSDTNRRRINTASAHNNVLVNNNIYGNNMNYGNNYLSNYNINNNQSERPKTSTNFKVKPIPRTNYNYQNNNNYNTKSKTLDNNINLNGFVTPNYILSNKNQNDLNNKNPSNNILLNSFKKGDLGYGFYMNNNNIIEDAKNQKIANNNFINNNNEYIMKKDFGNNYPSQNNKEFNKFENINSFPNSNNNYNDEELIEERMTEDIDNMLKYYMVQLNEKLDDSYGSIEDSSLSYNLSLPFAESISNNKKNNNIESKTNTKNNYMNKNTNNNNNNTNANNIHPNSGKIKLPTIKDKQNTSKEIKSDKPEEEAKNRENQVLRNQKKNEKKPENKNLPNTNEKITEIKKDKKEQENKEKESKEKDKKEKEIKEKENKEKEDKEKEKEKEKDKEKDKDKESNTSNIISNNISKISDNINVKAEVKNDSFIDDIILEDDNIANDENKEKGKEKEKENKNIDENKNNNNEVKKEENLPINANINNNNLQDSKEKELDIDENIEIVEDKKEEAEPEIKYGFHGEKTDNENEQPQQTQNERYSLEENIYDNLRLIKSSGGDYLHQNMEKFDIEYMCRCLSLAIMKLLESSKGKQHITDIMEKDNEKFEFFNNLFNSNMDIISDFFGKNKDNKSNEDNTTQKISNLEKLELKENKTVDDNSDITLLKHIKTELDDKLLKDQEIKNKQFKLKNNLADIEKDIKFIDEFFSMGRKRVKNYQNISEQSKNILNKELSYINEVDSEINNTNKTNSIISNNNDKYNTSKHSGNENSNIKELLNENDIIEEEDNKEEDNKEEDNYENEFDDIDKNNNKGNNNDNNNKDIEGKEKKENENEINNELNNKFSSISNINSNDISKKDLIKSEEKKENEKEKEDDLNQNLKIDELIKNNEQIKEELPPINQPNDLLNKNNKEIFESGSMESDYIIDVTTIDKFKAYLLKQAEVFDDDFIYSAMHIPTRKYVPPPDPQVVFEFCANIMILTKMEKEVIIITLLYLERFIFNTGLLLTSRNWRRIIFITMAIASKIWDDDSFENNHFAQVFKHLSIGEINLLERTFLELINYKVYVKCSEYFKYFFIIKSIALKYNYNGVEMIPISVERMMKIQEYAYQMQKRVRKKVNLSNSTKF